MSPSAYITSRVTKAGKRYIVRYRMGGRDTPLVHAGSFKTQTAAKERRDFCIAEIAAGRDPRTTLQQIAHTKPTLTVRQAGAAMAASRLDISDSRKDFLEMVLRTRVNPSFGDQPVTTLTPVEVQVWVTGMAAELMPGTVQKYWQVLAQTLDYADVQPNPARHHTVKLPYVDTEEGNPPNVTHLLAMLERVVKPINRLAIVTIEQTGARVGEINRWEFQDIDETACRIRSRGIKGRRGTRRVMWREIPPWLLRIILDTVPPDDRTSERRIFPGIGDATLRGVMDRACEMAKIPHYHPHDLRHRRGSLWHAGGMTARELAARLGHKKASMSLDVYTHVMPPEEAGEDVLRALLVRDR